MIVCDNVNKSERVWPAAVCSLQVPRLRVYINFCANQPFAKAMLDAKRLDPAVDDFLLRCQESPFSRKLDLWGLLGK